MHINILLGVHRFGKAKKESEKMGEAAGTVHRAKEIFIECGPFMTSIPVNYNINYQNKSHRLNYCQKWLKTRQKMFSSKL